MDPALPPGGLERIFSQYDAIRIHSTRDDGPAPYMPEEDQVPPAKQPAAPTPAAKPTEIPKTDNPAPPKEVPPEPSPTPTKPPEITADPAPDGNVGPVLTDATQARPKGRPKSWQPNNIDQLRGELGRRKFLHDLSNPTRSTFCQG